MMYYGFIVRTLIILNDLQFTDAMRRQVEAPARRNATVVKVAAARARNKIIKIDEGDEGGTGEVEMRVGLYIQGPS